MTIRNIPDSRLARYRLTKSVLAAAVTLVVASLATACSSSPSSSQAVGPATLTTRAAASTPPSTAVSAPAAGATASVQPTAAASEQSTRSTGSDPLAVLAPAIVPPVSDECTQALIHDADGNVQPISCAGGVNVDAWQYYASSGGSKLLTLGRDASQTAIYQAMCYDYNYVFRTKPIVGNVEQIAQAYYGWTVNAGALQQQLVIHGCPSS